VPDVVVPDVVVPDVVAVSVAVVPVPVVAVDEASVPVVDVVAGPADDSPDDVEVELLDVDDSEDVPVVSAAANPWLVATAVTSQAATAMPPYPPSFAAP
jgi:hypothetical protein